LAVSGQEVVEEALSHERLDTGQGARSDVPLPLFIGWHRMAVESEHDGVFGRVRPDASDHVLRL
jgi:hypothetical protein